MHPFSYKALPTRVVFGSGSVRHLGAEIERLSLRRVLFLSTPGQEEDVRSHAGKVGPVCVDVFPGAEMHTPISVTEKAMEMVREHRVDGVVAIGGGSTTGLAKAIAWRTDIPQIVVPTTFAGSEMTPILGETDRGEKVTFSDPKVLPEVAIYDVDLIMTLPAAAAAASGMNSMAHAIEALYAPDRNPVVSLMAGESIRALYGALPRIVGAEGTEAYEVALYGAWLSGICLGSVTMSLHHKLCHVLGGMFNLPHAEMHSILLPHVVAYNLPALGEIGERMKDMFAAPDPAGAIFDLNRGLGIMPSLAALGMPSEGIDAAVSAVLSKSFQNPRAIEREALLELFKRAHSGQTPIATI
jgi:maleylacetate reductase